MFTDRKFQQQKAQTQLMDFNEQSQKDTLALQNFMSKINQNYSIQEALSLSMNGASEAATRHAVEMGGASNTLETFSQKQNEVRKGLQANADSFSAASMKGKAYNMLLQGLSMAGNMLVFAAVSKGIELAATAIDNHIHRVEYAKESLEETKEGFSSITSELDSLNAELETQQERINELSARKNLTYMEKGELEKLKEATKELERQIVIKNQEAAIQANKLARENKHTFDLEYNDDSFKMKDVQELITSGKYEDENGLLRLEEEGIEGTAAALMKMQEAYKQAEAEHNNIAMEQAQDSIQYYKDLLVGDLSNLQNYWNTLNEIMDFRDLTADELAFYDNLEQGMKLISSFTDSNGWNALEIDSIFDTEGIEITKEELVSLAKDGTLDEATISNYKNLVKAIEESDLIFDDTSNSIAAFLEEIAALADKCEESLEVDLTTDPLSKTRTKLAEAGADLDKLSGSYQEFKELGYVTAQSLESLPDVFQDLEGFDLFAETAGNPSQGVEQIQEAFNELTAQYLLSKDTLTGLFNASESEVQSYIANLKQMGIQNAEELVNQVRSLPADIPILNNAEEEYFNYLEHKKGYDADYINSIYSKNSLLLAALGAPYQADY